MTSAFADPPITPKAAATRVRLLEVAAAVFIKHGYAAVSLRDIAKAAEVTKGGHLRPLPVEGPALGGGDPQPVG